MEEKAEDNQSQSSDKSASSASSSSDSASGSNPSKLNATTDKIIGDVKKFQTMSLAGIGMVIAFILFSFIDAFTLSWWIMLPLAGGSTFLLYRQHAETKGFEKKVCFYALITLLVFVVGRDIRVTARLAQVADYADTMKDAVKASMEKLPKN